MSVLKSLTLAAALIVGLSSFAGAQNYRQQQRLPAAQSYSYNYNTTDSSAFADFQDKWKSEY
jgi:hypothetical protein